MASIEFGRKIFRSPCLRVPAVPQIHNALFHLSASPGGGLYLANFLRREQTLPKQGGAKRDHVAILSDSEPISQRGGAESVCFRILT